MYQRSERRRGRLGFTTIFATGSVYFLWTAARNKRTLGETFVETPVDTNFGTKQQKLEKSDALTEEEVFQPATPPLTAYRMQAGVGARGYGHVSVNAAGVAGERIPQHWSAGYSRQGRRNLRGVSNKLNLEIAEAGFEGSLRLTREFLPGDDTDSPDGSGLDLHLETGVEKPWAADYAGGLIQAKQEPTPIWQQKAELVAGPRAQAKYLNVSLPFGLLVGASVKSDSKRANKNIDATLNTDVGPVKIYARLSPPGAKQLHGWTWAADLMDSWVGVLRGRVHQPWSREKGGRTWAAEHMTNHNPVEVPRQIATPVSAIAAAVGKGFDKTPVVVVPSTRVRAGNEGVAAALRLQNSEFLPGRSAWDGTLEVSNQGLAGQLQLAGDSSTEWGKPQYTLKGHVPWRERAHFAHELKWSTVEGNGAWLQVQPKGRGDKRGHRVKVGMEFR